MRVTGAGPCTLLPGLVDPALVGDGPVYPLDAGWAREADLDQH
ncbi:hypothetical protein AB0O75_49215 [Streptomyces sp. NPDC088921]